MAKQKKNPSGGAMDPKAPAGSEFAWRVATPEEVANIGPFLLNPKQIPTFDEAMIWAEIVGELRMAKARRQPITSFRQLADAIELSLASTLDNLKRIEAKFEEPIFDRDALWMTNAGMSVYAWAVRLKETYELGRKIEFDKRDHAVTVGFDRFPATVLSAALAEDRSFASQIRRFVVKSVGRGDFLAELDRFRLDLWVGLAPVTYELKSKYYDITVLTDTVHMTNFKGACNTRVSRECLPITLAERAELDREGQMFCLPTAEDAIRLIGASDAPFVYYDYEACKNKARKALPKHVLPDNVIMDDDDELHRPAQMIAVEGTRRDAEVKKMVEFLKKKAESFWGL